MHIDYTVNGDVLTVFDRDYVPTSIDSSHPNYQAVMDRLSGKTSKPFTLDYILELMQPITAVKKAVAGTSEITVTDSQVLYNGTPLHGVLIDRILGGDKVDHLVAFLGKLMNNPSHRAVNELYLFLEKNNHAILPDGNFVAYKIVDRNYKDLYTHTFDNSPGQVVTVPRNQVDEDSNRTCSKGLHVCGFEYLDKYGSARNGTDRVVSVSINPADVVAVPSDYNNAKMRVCSYVVLNDISDRTNLWVGGALDYTDDSWDWYREESCYDDYLDSLYVEKDWVVHNMTSYKPSELSDHDLVDTRDGYGDIINRYEWANDVNWRDVFEYRVHN